MSDPTTTRETDGENDPSDLRETVRERVTETRDKVAEAMAEAKPRLRGWLHLGTAPLTLAAGIVLLALSPTTASRVGSGVFALTALVLFTVSAIYHRGTWSRRTWSFLRRFDHANIFLLIAGSYTPFTLILLEGSTRTLLLWIIWAAAAAGVLFRIFWSHAPRWLYVPIYIGMGWAAVLFLPEFMAAGSPVVLWLILAGGLCYTVGGLVYALKWPDPHPGWFGFHEVFHLLTIAGFATHFVGVSIATYTLA